VIWSHKHVASWLSALITQVSPVITAVLAWIVLGESISAVAAFGGAITVGATMAVIALDAGEADEQHLEEAAEKVS
jgi:drug/metabolite transporter (DMT)-like permease